LETVKFIFQLIIAIGLGLFMLVCFLVIIVARKQSKLEERIKRTGQTVIGWFVQANSTLFEPGTNNSPAMIVFTFDQAAERAPEFLSRVAHEMYRLKSEPPANPTEAEVARLMESERYHAGQRTLLPSAFTHNRPVYCAHVMVLRELLPEGHLTDNFHFFKAIPGDGPTDVVMISAPG
jgi:hypothetical protein